MQLKENWMGAHIVRDGEGKRFNMLGAHLLWKARGNDTDGMFTLATQTLAPGEQIQAHRHGYPEVFFITSGDLLYTLFDGGVEVKYPVTQGDAVIVPANSYHSVVNLSHADATLLDIACFEHQKFFDELEHKRLEWDRLSPEKTMEQFDAIALRHSFEFHQP